jgi:hypothetical protein
MEQMTLKQPILTTIIFLHNLVLWALKRLETASV